MYRLKYCPSLTPVNNWYLLEKVVDDDPMFDKNKAKKKLRKYVDTHDHAIRLKAEIIVDHFFEFVIAPRKVGGEASAMVICSTIPLAVQYYRAVKSYLQDIKSSYQAIVAFSGEAEVEGAPMMESQLIGFPSDEITDQIQEHPYRFLVCENTVQTG